MCEGVLPNLLTISFSIFEFSYPFQLLFFILLSLVSVSFPLFYILFHSKIIQLYFLSFIHLFFTSVLSLSFCLFCYLSLSLLFNPLLYLVYIHLVCASLSVSSTLFPLLFPYLFRAFFYPFAVKVSFAFVYPCVVVVVVLLCYCINVLMLF